MNKIKSELVKEKTNGERLKAHSNMKESSIFIAFFILLSILTSPYRCDTNSSSVNVTNNQQSSSYSYSNKSSKSGDGFTATAATASSNDDQNGQQIPLVRLPSNTLLKYTAYKDVSIQHFLIPMDTRTATFSFKSNEESKSALSKFKH